MAPKFPVDINVASNTFAEASGLALKKADLGWQEDVEIGHQRRSLVSVERGWVGILKTKV